MQKTYFLYENGQPSPPYTIEELKAKHLTGDTMICEKFGTWKPVRELPELQELWEWGHRRYFLFSHQISQKYEKCTNCNGRTGLNGPYISFY